MDEEAIKNFRAYLRIKSVQPNINYDECIEFLKGQANSLNLPYKLYKQQPNQPIFIITWTGTEPNLPSIWLNSHMDVVPVYEEKWTYKPFDAHIDAQGNIYGRGAQDMKSVGIQYLEAIRRLKKKNVSFRRTIHVAFVADEELPKRSPLGFFVSSKEFEKLNVGFALDEGMASTTNSIHVFYGERLPWPIRIHCTGQQGHGSLLLADPPGNKLDAIVSRFNEFRHAQIKQLELNPQLTLGDVITVNLTQLEGGVQANVVPPKFIATFDMRIPSKHFSKHLSDVEKWCKEIGVQLEHILDKQRVIPDTKIDDSNLFWVAFKKALDNMNVPNVTSIFPAGTDAQNLREVGIPALGFSPITNTLVRLHDNDEYLNVDVFLKGIQIYIEVIPAIANC